jgi:BMFP domain-containing protein YqiC
MAYDTINLMITAKFLKQFAQRLSESLPAPLKVLHSEFEKQVQAGLKAAFEKLDLVSREEFDVQTEVLARTRDKLQKLENRLQLLEQSSLMEEAPLDTQGTNGKF